MGECEVNWDEFRCAFNTARSTMNQADSVADSMADMLVGRLQKCSGHTLAKLKRELRDFNIQTHEWKADK